VLVLVMMVVMVMLVMVVAVLPLGLEHVPASSSRAAGPTRASSLHVHA